MKSILRLLFSDEEQAPPEQATQQRAIQAGNGKRRCVCVFKEAESMWFDPSVLTQAVYPILFGETVFS